MKYLLMIYGNDDIWGALSQEEFAEVIAEHATFRKELEASGELVMEGGLTDPVNARVVKVREGAPVVTDGPYLEAKEFLGSFVLIDVEDLDRALELAARYPIARRHGVEVWPLMDDTAAEL
jgi:hypothetical protein